MPEITIAKILDDEEPLVLDVHDQLISEPLAILGVRHIGKSYQAGRICEELCSAGQPFIVIDPEGEYWTLKERYPVIVASVGTPVGRPEGYRADVTLTAETAPNLAGRIAEKGYSLVLDLRNATMVDSYTALAGFLEALYEAEARYNRPLVLVMEEAHVLCPEVGRIRLPEVRQVQSKVIHWTWEIAARGRHRGLGYVCIARRAAEVAKAVLTQCPIRFVFKLVDPADLSWLRQSGLDREEIDKVSGLPRGQAVVLGLSDRPLFVETLPRECTHGGQTPIARAVETPELSQAVEDLAELIETPPPPGVPEELRKEFEASRAEVLSLRDQVSKLEAEIGRGAEAYSELLVERDTLRKRVSELEARVMTSEERDRLQRRVHGLEGEVRDLREQLGRARELEGVFSQLRELMDEEKEIWIQQARLLGIELIPSDIAALQEERDALRARVESLEAEMEHKASLVQETLRDPGVMDWIRATKRIVSEFTRTSGYAGPKVLRAIVATDPTVAMLPEEFQTGYTESTNRQYLNRIVELGLAKTTTKRGRQAYQNNLTAYVSYGVRSRFAEAPDEAVHRIADELKRFILGG